MRRRRALTGLLLVTVLFGSAACGGSPKREVAQDAPTMEGVDPGTDAVPASPSPSPSPSPAAPVIKFPAVQPAIGEKIGMLEIPKIGLAHAVYQGFELTQIDHGPGHWPKSPLPGQMGNVVFAGHRVTHSRPFYDIDKLTPGDRFIFTTPAGRFTYEMTAQMIVKPTDVHILKPTPEATVTLFACHPKGSARQRYVVVGKLMASAPPAAA